MTTSVLGALVLALVTQLVSGHWQYTLTLLIGYGLGFVSLLGAQDA